MKSAPYPTSSWQPLVFEPPSKLHKSNTMGTTTTTTQFKMKSTTTTTTTNHTSKSRKRPSPKHTPLPPLPSISTLFESGASSHSSSSNSSYGSYCQFSPEGSYTMYHWPMNYFPYVPETVAGVHGTITATASTSTSDSQAVGSTGSTHFADSSTVGDEHKPFDQPLFIQTSDPFEYGASSDPMGGYPSSATINASQLLLRPVPNGQF